MKYTIAALSIGICFIGATEALAMRPCKPEKKDPRVCDVAYNLSDPVELYGAVGVPITIQIAPDEHVITMHVSDIEHVKPGWFENIITVKFLGCIVPEPMTIIARKEGVTAPRTYFFQVETIPTLCHTPDPAAKQGDPNFVSVQAAASVDAVSPLPNLKYLTSLDALTPTAKVPIPYLVKFTYPGDEAEAAAKRRRAEDARVEALQTKQLLTTAAKSGTTFTRDRQQIFFKKGNAELAPASMSDDGYTTTMIFPDMQEIPVVNRALNPAAGCGENGEEAVKDLSVAGQTVTISGTAQAWCLRANNGRILEIWNPYYNPVGRTTGTGTVLPNVVREIHGADDGR